jgi:nucleoside-diphosphate-sugar epimerase
MKLVLIGGTGFIGPFVIRTLLDQGHEVAVYHRGRANSSLPDGVRQIIGERRHLAAAHTQFRDFAPEVVIDFILASERQARATLDAFRGTASRVVAISSGDVYRAAGIIHGTEPGPLQPVPLTEDSDLRTQGQTYRQEVLEALRQTFPWLEDDYDKVPVERAILSDPELAGTVLRLPMVYGPGDMLHRLHPYLKRMDDGRPAILIQEDAAHWRGPRGYVENVAAAIALAATSPQAAGRIYNLAEPESPSELEWVAQIGQNAGWSGSVYATTPRSTGTMSSARIRAELGFAEPVPQDVAIAKTIQWERANPPAQADPKQFDYPAEDAALEQLRVHEKIALAGS